MPWLVLWGDRPADPVIQWHQRGDQLHCPQCRLTPCGYDSGRFLEDRWRLLCASACCWPCRIRAIRVISNPKRALLWREWLSSRFVGPLSSPTAPIYSPQSKLYESHEENRHRPANFPGRRQLHRGNSLSVDGGDHLAAFAHLCELCDRALEHQPKSALLLLVYSGGRHHLDCFRQSQTGVAEPYKQLKLEG